MKKSFKFELTALAAIFALAVFAGCADKEVRYLGDANRAEAGITMGLDSGDFQKAAADCVESLLKSGALDKRGGGRYVVAIDEVVNDTTLHIDTDLLIKKIRIAMLKSGKAVVTSAIKAGGAESTLTRSVRELRGDDEVASSTVANKGTIVAPNMGLGGKIIQVNSKTGKDKQIAEYYFQLTLTNLETGLVFWEDEVVVGKMGPNDSVTW